MDERGMVRRLPLAGAAVAGAVVGHTIAYALAAPDPGQRLAVLQLGIYLVQELLERAAAGVPVDGRLLLQGVLVQVLVAVTVAAALTPRSIATARIPRSSYNVYALWSSAS